MALTDWFELKHTQDIGASFPVLNVYHFRREGVTWNSTLINQAFLDSVVPTLRALQVPQVRHGKLITQNLGEPTDFNEVSLGLLPGTATAGDVAPSFTASRIQFLRERTDMNHGWKRYAGIPEVNLNLNTLSGTYPTTLQNLADILTDGIELASSPGVVIARLGIIARVCAEVDAAGVCVSYRMPENDAELDFYIPDNAVGRSTVGSQASRK